MDSREDLTALNARLAAAYSALEAAKTRTEMAGDAVEDAMNATGRIMPGSASDFADSLANAHSAVRRLAAAIAALPARDKSEG